MNRKWNRLATLLLLSVLLIVMSACGTPIDSNEGSTNNSTGAEQTPSPDNNGDDHTATDNNNGDDAIMAEFTTLVESNSGSAELILFMNAHMGEVSAENASEMVVLLERVQKEQLKDLETRFYEKDSFQLSMYELHQTNPDTDFANPDEVEDADLKQLLVDVRDGGYKVATSEGMYYPVMHYEAYQAYSSYVTKDMSAYINLMAVESNEVPAKDAALVIGWDEVVNRALTQEQFLLEYPDSAKFEAVQELHKLYLQFTFLGLNNTPLFDYDTQTIKPDAKAAYTEAISEAKASDYLSGLSAFMDVVDQNDGKLTDEVDQFRKKQIGE